MVGANIAITRSRDDAGEFIELARNNNMTPLPLPTIELVSKGKMIVEEFLESVRKYCPDYSVFMSSKAVRLLFETAKECSKIEELRLAVANTTVVAVGPKTAASLQDEGIKVNEMPQKTFSSVGIGELFTRLDATNKKAIVPRSGASTPFLKELLNKIGIDVLEIHLYDVRAFGDRTQWVEFLGLFSQGRVDGIVFTSASSVRGFFEIMAKDHTEERLIEALSNLHVVAIGPFTADELAKFHIRNQISEIHTVAGSFETINMMLSDSQVSNQTDRST